MRIPSLSRRTEPAPAGDENGDGRVDAADRATATATAPPPVTAPARTTETDQTVDLDRDRTVERPLPPPPARRTALTDRVRRSAPPPPPPPTTDRDAPTTDRDAPTVERTAPTVDRDVPAPEPTTDPRPAPVVAGAKPRASLLATLGLVVGVAGALFVLTGTLAGYGIGLGAAGAVLSVLGLVATRRRHVAGKIDALLGIGFGLGAVVVGILAMTGLYAWPSTDGDWVLRLREWLDSQFVGRF
ncbi:hypothetical protein AWW66_04640 [Micromonospora rosaria]|uniref:Thrombospondin n=1 Tax=Micromonospora rosaria TaxID=47874 RepID=A0A136PX82_9ACTN|nr:hypothetical protein [Micromonospora rosaria]KXK63081.1 hypothetical protein AWW66_04640 [Micromonospora rosaria]